MPAQSQIAVDRPRADRDELALALRRAGVGTGRVSIDVAGSAFTLRAMALNASQAGSTRRVLAKLARAYGNLALAPGWTRSDLITAPKSIASEPEPAQGSRLKSSPR